MSKCKDPTCYNYDDTKNSIFCEECLVSAVSNMDEGDLYDIFLEGEKRIASAIVDGEAHGILSSEDKRLFNKFKQRWFRTINNFMLRKERLK